MHEVLVNRLGGLSLPRKSVVRLTDRPDMTLDVYRGRKTTIQQYNNILTILYYDCKFHLSLGPDIWTNSFSKVYAKLFTIFLYLLKSPIVFWLASSGGRVPVVVVSVLHGQLCIGCVTDLAIFF